MSNTPDRTHPQKVNSSERNEERSTNVMEATDTDSSDVEKLNINKFGSKKTSRWNRPKIELPVKDLEKVPTRRSKRIHELKKDKAQTQVQYIF